MTVNRGDDQRSQEEIEEKDGAVYIDTASDDRVGGNREGAAQDEETEEEYPERIKRRMVIESRREAGMEPVDPYEADVDVASADELPDGWEPDLEAWGGATEE